MAADMTSIVGQPVVEFILRRKVNNTQLLYSSVNTLPRTCSRSLVCKYFTNINASLMLV